MLTFAQTVDHAVGFGDRDLQRFPHAHALHTQAQTVSGKLQRNIDEKTTKYRTYSSDRFHMARRAEVNHCHCTDMLDEMHGRMMQAVRRYDSLLTEQDMYVRHQQAQQRLQGTFSHLSPNHILRSDPRGALSSYVDPYGLDRSRPTQATYLGPTPPNVPLQPNAPNMLASATPDVQITQPNFPNLPHTYYDQEPRIPAPQEHQYAIQNNSPSIQAPFQAGSSGPLPGLPYTIVRSEASAIQAPVTVHSTQLSGNQAPSGLPDEPALPLLPSAPSHAPSAQHDRFLPQQGLQEEALLIEL
jgi:growth factor-regulated tyrosine kinase substrate